LKGRIAIPTDFDTMGQEEITALFAGEGIAFLTADETVAGYPGDIIYIRK
jgi:ethanolamine utilization protein EutQ (cupin superfamily)